MKKLIFILSIAAIGCTKPASFCYECVIVTRSSTGFSQTDSFEQCNWTDSDARAYEDAGTSVTKIGNNTITQKTECHIK